MNGNRHQDKPGSRFDGLRDAGDQARAAFKKPDQLLTKKHSDQGDSTQGESHIVVAKAIPASGTPRTIAKVITKRVSGQGISPAMNPKAAPSRALEALGGKAIPFFLHVQSLASQSVGNPVECQLSHDP